MLYDSRSTTTELIFCFMKTNEIYEEVMAEVTRTTGIDRNSVLNSNCEECVDARYLLVRALGWMLTDSEIARLTGRTRRGIAYLRSCEHKMQKRLVRRNWEEIRKSLGSNYFETA